MSTIIRLNRQLILIEGMEAEAFLQGLITNDVTKAYQQNQLLWTGLLTPQGKYLYDFFLFVKENKFYLDVESGVREELIAHLKKYRLRRKLEIVPYDEISVYAALEGNPVANHILWFDDPRTPFMGSRGYLFATTPREDDHLYHITRAKYGIPEGRRDMIIDKTIPLEYGFADLQAVAWDKGCYLGQELTARCHYRGLIRKRLFPLECVEGTFTPGDELFFEDKKMGRVISVYEHYILALLRLEAVMVWQDSREQLWQSITAKAALIIPPWMNLSQILQQE